MFLLFFTTSILSAQPTIQSIPISQLYEIMYKDSNLTSVQTVDDFISATINKPTYFVYREQGDTIVGDNFTWYDAYGTPQEVNDFMTVAQGTPQQEGKSVRELAENGNVIFIRITKSATYAQEAVFWVVIVFFIIFIGGVTSSLLIWHLDRYDLDPANSLLYVTEGNLIVSGINDHK